MNFYSSLTLDYQLHCQCTSLCAPHQCSLLSSRAWAHYIRKNLFLHLLPSLSWKVPQGKESVWLLHLCNLCTHSEDFFELKWTEQTAKMWLNRMEALSFFLLQVTLQRSKLPSWLKPCCKATDHSFGGNKEHFLHPFPSIFSFMRGGTTSFLFKSLNSSKSVWAITPLLKSVSLLPNSPKIWCSSFCVVVK